MTEAIRFRSTRNDGQETVSLEEAIREGLAPDGGLFMPTKIPHVPSEELSDVSFTALAARALAAWTGPVISDSELDALVEDAFDFDVPLVPLGDSGDHVLELFHGPTLSFKDFGARTMSRLLAHHNADASQPVTILVATSGDTGSAVADGFVGAAGIRVVLLYPEGQVSPTQEKQLIASRPNVFPLRVQGAFDDCQKLVKGAFADERLAGMTLSTANSINIGRLLPQSIYYLWAQRRLGRDDIRFVVPSGNLGNLTAGTIARAGGMPCKGFVAAHNRNDFFPRFLRGEQDEFKDSVQTLSNAMDVGAPSNFERLRHLLGDDDIRRLIWGASVDDEQTLASIRTTRQEAGYLADPHTAVGIESVRRFRDEHPDDDSCFVILSTAHPAKFPEVMAKAGFEDIDVPDRLLRLDHVPKSFEDMPADRDSFADYLLDLPEID